MSLHRELGTVLRHENQLVVVRRVYVAVEDGVQNSLHLQQCCVFVPLFATSVKALNVCQIVDFQIAHMKGKHCVRKHLCRLCRHRWNGKEIYFFYKPIKHSFFGENTKKSNKKFIIKNKKYFAISLL